MSNNFLNTLGQNMNSRGPDITSRGPDINLSSATVVPVNYFDQTLISDNDFSLLTLVVDAGLSFAVGVLGVVGNVLTMVVFARMGFRETVNITMTAISFWDLVRVLCGTVNRCYGPVSLASPSMGRSWRNITFTNLVYLHIVASNVSYVIGSYVALERCLCVSRPLKVKIMLTPLLTVIICAAISLTIFILSMPVFLILDYRWVSGGDQYESPMAVYEFTPFYKQHGKNYMAFYQYMNLLYSVSSLVIMVVSTMVISNSLHRMSIFRKNNADHVNGDNKDNSNLSTKDRQVVKMLLIVIATYIVVLLPRAVSYIVQSIVPEYYILKYYNNIFLTVVYVAFFLDFVNSSVGLIIFYNMSSKFRSNFISLFRKTVQKQTK